MRRKGPQNKTNVAEFTSVYVSSTQKYFYPGNEKRLNFDGHVRQLMYFNQWVLVAHGKNLVFYWLA